MIYLVDFSPSLCEVARQRFARLGWNNVKVVCEDARKFKLGDYEIDFSGGRGPTRAPSAELITMSYSLSMIVRGSTRQLEYPDVQLMIYIAGLLLRH